MTEAKREVWIVFNSDGSRRLVADSYEVAKRCDINEDRIVRYVPEAAGRREAESNLATWAVTVLDESGFEWCCSRFSIKGEAVYLCSVSLDDGTELVGRSEESKAGSRISAAKQLYDEDSSDYPSPPSNPGAR